VNPFDVKTALLGGIIDYAGTFPPASLSLVQALQKAASYRKESAHPWLMGRVALTMDDLKKLSPRALYQNGADGSPWVFTALGNLVANDTPEEFTRCVEWDVREIRRCLERWHDGSVRMEIVGYEIKMPAELEAVAVEAALDRIVELMGWTLAPYVEMAWEGDWERRLYDLAMTLGRWREEGSDIGLIPAIKVRTGGIFTPSPEQLGEVITACVLRGLRFKATQGLHTCLTRGKDYGYVNLMLSLALAQSLGAETFGPAKIAECLMVSNPREFIWDEDSITWNNFTIDVDTIEDARGRHGGCFGSCSLDEPDQSLIELFSEES